jgi:hypothetical protein
MFLHLASNELERLANETWVFTLLRRQLAGRVDTLRHRQYPPGRKQYEIDAELESLWSQALSDDITLNQSGWYTPGIHNAVGHWRASCRKFSMIHGHRCSCHHYARRRGCNVCQLLRRNEDYVEDKEVVEDETNIARAERQWLKGKWVFPNLDLVSGKGKPNGRGRRGKIGC